MNASATLQHNIQIRRSRFAGVVLAVASLSAVTAWSITNAATESHQSNPNVVADSHAEAPDGRAAQLDARTVDSQQQRRLDSEAKLGVDLDDFDTAEQDFLIGLAESDGDFLALAP
jgi:hypothetical protein